MMIRTEDVVGKLALHSRDGQAFVLFVPVAVIPDSYLCVLCAFAADVTVGLNS
jgi:hypothetical protein